VHFLRLQALGNLEIVVALHAKDVDSDGCCSRCFQPGQGLFWHRDLERLKAFHFEA